MEQDTEEVEEFIFADDKSTELKVHCPLCKRIFSDPYITTCGHTFCLKCINKDSTGVCPIDHTHLSPVVRNIAVFEQVGELLVYCKYANNGKDCKEVIKINDKPEHERNCQYRIVACPNSTNCPKMLQKDLEDHLTQCSHMKCPHNKYGCHFEGSSVSVTDHVKECKYEGIKGYLQSLDDMISNLRHEISSKDDVIAELKSTVVKLEERLEISEKLTSSTTKRLESLEEETGSVVKALSQSNDGLNIVMSKLNVVEHQLHQLGINPMVPQHMFKCQGTFVGHKGPVWCLCVSNDYLFSASSDNTIKVWNLSAIYEGPRTMTGHDGIVLAVCSKDHLLYSGSSDKTIKVWNMRTLKLETSFVAHDDPICTLTTHENRLYSGSLRSIKVWDLTDNNSLIKILPTQNHWVRALVASGNYLYSGSYRAVKIWNLESMEVAHVLQCNGGSVYSLALTDRHIVCGTYENMIHVWDINTLTEITSLTGHVGTIYSLAVLPTPGGQSKLFSASYDKTIRVWSLELFTCAQTMSRHEGSVTSLTINRGRVISGSVDNTIKVWQ